MGSKSGMLQGALGENLLTLVGDRGGGFFDLFSGSGAVGNYVAKRSNTRVVTADLMNYSAAISAATIERTEAIESDAMLRSWESRVAARIKELASVEKGARRLSDPRDSRMVLEARAMCADTSEPGFIWSDYGGHYFSPLQALQLSLRYAELPTDRSERAVALAALLRSASRLAASPGHTAQPFQPTDRLLPHIRAAWRMDTSQELARQVGLLAPAFARVRGEALVADAQSVAETLVGDNDVAFCDPPYSEAQYSRFYHVLEGIAVGGWSSVGGAGRAPVIGSRKSSEFSSKRLSVTAARKLLEALARNGASVVWTYPEGERSNGLTVADLRDAISPLFHSKEVRVEMRHSTLGGPSSGDGTRRARRDLHEVVFVLTPR